MNMHTYLSVSICSPQIVDFPVILLLTICMWSSLFLLPPVEKHRKQPPFGLHDKGWCWRFDPFITFTCHCKPWCNRLNFSLWCVDLILLIHHFKSSSFETQLAAIVPACKHWLTSWYIMLLKSITMACLWLVSLSWQGWERGKPEMKKTKAVCLFVGLPCNCWHLSLCLSLLFSFYYRAANLDTCYSF